MLAAYRYRFARDTEALTGYLVDVDAIGWDHLGDDLLDGAPDDLRTVLNPYSIGPSEPTDSVHVVTRDGSPPLRMVFDECSAPGSLEWAYVLRPEGIEVVSLTYDTHGPVVDWDCNPLISVSDEPHRWVRGLPIPLAVPQPPPALSATRTTPAGPPTARRPSRR